MSEAMRVKPADVPRMKERLREMGVADWVVKERKSQSIRKCIKHFI